MTFISTTSKLVNESPLNANLVALFIKLFYDYVNQKFYAADLVGISYNISTNKFGLEVCNCLLLIFTN